MSDLKALHDFVLISPLKEENKLWTPPDDLTPTVIKGTIIDVGPFVGGYVMSEAPDEFIGSHSGFLEMKEKTKRNKVSVGDMVYFPSGMAFQLGTAKHPVYAVRELELIAVEKLDDLAME